MKCVKAQHWILRQDSGELAPRRHSSLAKHIARCPTCRAWQADMLVITRLAAQARSPVDPSEPTVQAVIEHARRQRTVTGSRRWPWFWPLAAAATLLLALGGWLCVGSIRTQMLARQQSQRVREIHALAILLGDLENVDHVELPPVSHEEALRALARQILLWQDSGAEEIAADGGVTPPGEPPPTAFRGRSTRAVPAGRCG